MIYLTSGANGAGKTLLTLRDVRAQQLAENRPVFYNGFDLKPEKAAEFGWQKFDPRKWMDLPDGSICVMDECQNEFPLRKSTAELPQYVQDVAQYRRKRGFDFWMITPHPMLVDVFIRRLIDNPSWHRHIKRTAGAQLVSVIKWNAVNTNCEKPGSGDSGQVSMVAYPKEVFGWYDSASLHTGKTKIPRAVFVLAACLVLIPAAGYLGFQQLMAPSRASKEKAELAAKAAPPAPQARAPQALQAAQGPLTTLQYAELRAERFAGFPHTAPAYDAVTAPVTAPFPSACIAGVSPRTKKKECNCFTQQGTRLQTPADLCAQIVANGYFVDWKQDPPKERAREGAAAELAPTAPRPLAAQLQAPTMTRSPS